MFSVMYQYSYKTVHYFRVPNFYNSLSSTYFYMHAGRIFNITNSLQFSEKGGWTMIFLTDQVSEQTNIFDVGIKNV